jgi:dTDP-4-dehydrorhamnose 3,5-epimerase
VKVEALEIPDVKLVTPAKHGDARGFFSETWQQERFAEAGIPGPFIQDNHAMSTQRGVLRGLHLQVPPSAQGKLVRVVRGAIWDVAVDVRHGSASFGKWVAAELSGENWRQLWVPVGFLHGYCTLTEVTEVIYKVSGPYDRAAERGVIWNDPDLALPWPVSPGEVVLSEKDKVLPRLADCPVWFTV